MHALSRQADAGAAALILIVEDDEPMRSYLRATLTDRDYRVAEAATGEDALAQASQHGPRLVLLDLGLPDLDGLEVTRRLRDWTSAPIIVVSARGCEDDKIEILDAGANDYVTKPFATRELLARIRVWLRQSERLGDEPGPAVLEVGPLRLDLARRRVFSAERETHLTPTEYKLFATLMRNPGRVLTHKELLETVWGPAFAGETQYLRVYMAQLRQKLEAQSARPRYLLTEPGVGYRLRDD